MHVCSRLYSYWHLIDILQSPISHICYITLYCVCSQLHHLNEIRVCNLSQCWCRIHIWQHPRESSWLGGSCKDDYQRFVLPNCINNTRRPYLNLIPHMQTRLYQFLYTVYLNVIQQFPLWNLQFNVVDKLVLVGAEAPQIFGISMWRT